MTPLTLKYSTTEKWLGPPGASSSPGWGFGRAVMHLRSQALSTFTLTKPGDDPAGAHETPIPNWGNVAIYKDRAWSGSAFTGGTIIFQGRRTDFNGRAQPEARDNTLVFSDPWYDLEQIIYQHYWQYRASGSGANATQYFSRLNLFQDISAGPGTAWSYLTTQAQIQQIINYAAAASPAANIQVGTVDPAFNVPIYGVKGITCAEALQICLKVCPDCVTFFDYTTSPPTLHVRQRSTLSSLVLPYAGTDAHSRSHRSSRIRPRYDLIPEKVVVDYQITNRVDSTCYVNFASYAYPAGTDRGLGVQVCPIDVNGAVKTNVTGSVVAEAIDPTLTAFWTHPRRKPDLDSSTHPEISGLAIIDTTINGGANPQGITIVDDAGNPVSLATYPNEVTDKAVSPWMYAGSTQIIAKKVTITAHLSYVKKDTRNGGTALPLLTPSDHVVSYRCTLTNSAVGTVNYSAQIHSDPGEPVITDLAQNLYNAVSALQWEGEHVIVEDSLYSVVTPGAVLNLSGGNTDWATMNAQIYDVEIDFFHGRTTVNFGPHKHLSAGQFFEYLTFYQRRFLYDNPNLRNTGQAGNDSTVQTDATHPESNTNHGQPIPQLLGILGAPDGSNNQLAVYHDPGNGMGNGQLVIGKMLSTGSLDATTPAVKINLADLSGSDVASLRAVGGGKVLCTAGFAAGGSWRGNYSNATTYYPGDLVLMTTGAAQGVYVMSYGSSISGHDPVYPYSGTQYWTVIAFTPYDFTVCVGGASKTTHMNATPPA